MGPSFIDGFRMEKKIHCNSKRTKATSVFMCGERRGFLNDNFISFDHSRREVDEKVMAEQAILEGGPLLGKTEIQGISEEEASAVKENLIGDDKYVRLGERIVQDIIYPSVHRLL